MTHNAEHTVFPRQPAFRFTKRPQAWLVTALCAATGPAGAHVKWFSRDADCAMPPLPPLQVVSAADFVLLGGVSLLVMAGVSLLDARLSRPGSVALKLADAAETRASAWLPPLLRLGLAAFFLIAVLYFGGSPVFLTPELHARQAWVSILQLTIAATLLWRPTAWLGALGIGALYAAAVAAHGWFHLLDYPVFLAAATFVAIDSLGRARLNNVALAVLRVGAGITLMWAGAEKWLYPWWSYDVLDHQLLAARGGLSSSFFMAAAGWVEFCAAYALVFGRLGTQVAAWLLLVPFLAAIPIFGELDAIGHAPIVVVLVILGLTRTRLPPTMQGISTPSEALRRGITCTLSGLASVGVYGGLQALAYPRGAGLPRAELMVVVLVVAPLLLWLLPRLQRRLQAVQAVQASSEPGPYTGMAQSLGDAAVPSSFS